MSGDYATKMATLLAEYEQAKIDERLAQARYDDAAAEVDDARVALDAALEVRSNVQALHNLAITELMRARDAYWADVAALGKNG